VLFGRILEGFGVIRREWRIGGVEDGKALFELVPVAPPGLI